MNAVVVVDIDERARYDAWWQSGPGRPCEVCRQGKSIDATAIRLQGESFFPMRNFGPDSASLPVGYLVVAMEPSADWVNKRKKKGRKWRDAVNFSGTGPHPNSVVQFAAREWLCDVAETFLITDMAKCCATNARATRFFRWRNCDAFLRAEAEMFHIRAVIAVGKIVRDALRERAWLGERPLFRVLHWSGVGVAHHQKVYRALAQTEQHVSDETIARFRAFVNERRIASGSTPKRSVAMTDQVTKLIAVYRRQFQCIQRALVEPSWACERRADGTCCRAVPHAAAQGGGAR